MNLRQSIPRVVRCGKTRAEWLQATLKKVADLVTDETVPEEDPLRKDFIANRLPPYKQPQQVGKLKV